MPATATPRRSKPGTPEYPGYTTPPAPTEPERSPLGKELVEKSITKIPNYVITPDETKDELKKKR